MKTDNQVGEIPTTGQMLDDLAKVFDHDRLQAEISRRYRVNCSLRRMEIVAEIWRDHCALDTRGEKV